MPNNDEINNDEVLGAMMFEKARTDYPYLADKDIAYKYSPKEGRGFLEFYDPQEPGSPEYPRPKELPLGKVGIEVFDPKTKPIDILADYVSHYGVEKDPYLSERYKSKNNKLKLINYKQKVKILILLNNFIYKLIFYKNMFIIYFYSYCL